MARLNKVELENANGQAKELLSGVKAKIGMVPNLYATMVNSPAVLESYLGFQDTLDKSSLSKSFREQIALVVSEFNGCDYCLSAHTAIGKMVGLNEDEILKNRDGVASDLKAEIALNFAKHVLETKGKVSNDELNKIKEFGYSDAQITEIIATVIATTFTNYINNVAETEIDFPLVTSKVA